MENISHTEVFAMNHPPFDADEMGLCKMPFDASFERVHLRTAFVGDGTRGRFPVFEKCKPEEATHLSVSVRARMTLTSSSRGDRHTREERWEVIFFDFGRYGHSGDSPDWRLMIIRALDADGYPLG